MRTLTLSLCAMSFAVNGLLVASNGVARPSSQTGFQIADYFRVERIPELVLSSDGALLAYVTQSTSGGRAVHLRALGTRAMAKPLPRLAGARDLAWIPGSRILAYISSAEPNALFVYDTRTGAEHTVLRAEAPIVGFRYSPDGRSIAFVTEAATPPTPSLYRQFRDGNRGILVNSDTTSLYDFLNPEWNGLTHPAARVLWIKRADFGPARVAVPGTVEGAEWGFWSPDSRRLIVTYVASGLTADQLSGEHSSIGIVDSGTLRFEPLACGRGPKEGKPGVSYMGGEWIPVTGKILLRRVIERNPWTSDSFPDWAIVRPFPSAIGKAIWHPIEVYPVGLRFFPLSAQRMLVENTVSGVHSLFSLTSKGMSRSPVVSGISGSSSGFQFSADDRSIVFINQSLTRPPELYLRAGRTPPHQITHLNDAIRHEIGFQESQVSWTSVDGTRLEGWLLVPPAASSRRPWPILVFVHGGPSFPFPDEFAPYFDYWPYPLGVLAQTGIAVFIPNYRGTESFGSTIANPQGYMAIDDIVSGVKFLIARGVAERDDLGIAGHSHGAWLGPLVMARSRMFKAASFAEGIANSVVMYELVSGDANRDIHDKIVGASLYHAPERYLRESPDLEFEGLHTAALFEGGSRSTALLMLGFAKAAKRAGMPAELVVYPHTGHNIADPALQRDSAERNLGWFQFWLQGLETSQLQNPERYRR